MPNFRWIGHFDTLAVMPRLHALQPGTWKGVPERGEVNHPEIGMGASLLLRGHAKITQENWLDDLPVKDQPALLGGGTKPLDKPWASMQRLLGQCKKAIIDEHARMLESGVLQRPYLSGQVGRAMVSRLDPGSTIFWHLDDGPYHSKHVRFHLPLVTNPGCLLYSGPEHMHLPVGGLFYFNNRVRHSAANWGATHRLHLIFEMRRVDESDE